MSAEG
jgi:hypothetical protein